MLLMEWGLSRGGLDLHSPWPAGIYGVEKQNVRFWKLLESTNLGCIALPVRDDDAGSRHKDRSDTHRCQRPGLEGDYLDTLR